MNIDISMKFSGIFICTKGENKEHTVVLSLEVNQSDSLRRQIFHVKPLDFPLLPKEVFFVYFCFAAGPPFKVKHVLFSLCEYGIY